MKLTLVLLMAHLNTRWARDGIADEEAGRAVLSHGDLLAITGRSRRDIAEKSLRSLTEVVTMTVERRGDFMAIDWTKFAEFQEYASRTRGSRKANERPLQSESESESESITKTEEKKRSEAPSAPPAKRAPRASSKTLCPDTLAQDEWIGILKWASAEGFPSNEVLREWQAMRDHWVSRRESRADWPATFRSWLRNAKRFAARDARVNGSLSPAQAKAERTKDAGRQAYELLQQRKLGLIEGGAA